MIKVNQNRYGGPAAPLEEKGNCFQAAVASVLEMNLDEVPNIQDYGQDKNGDWLDKFRRWLSGYGLGIICLEVPENSNNMSQGYHLIEVESTILEGEHHVVVGLNGNIVHDPNDRAKAVGKQIYHYIFTLLNPAMNVASPQVTI